MKKYHLATVTPAINEHAAAGTAYSDNDVLFTWTNFDIPRGAAKLKTIQATIAGTNGAAGNTHDISLYFARSIDGIAPPSFGTIHAATTALLANAFRRYLIGYKLLDLSAMDDEDHLIAYNPLGSRADEVSVESDPQIILQTDGTPFQGDSTYSATVEGYDTYWVGAIAHGAFDFGTDIQLNQGSHQAAATAETTLTIEQGGDGAGVANNSFAVGDTLIGGTGGPTMEVTDLVTGTATSLKVKNISEQIDDDEQLLLKDPIRLHFGFEY